VYESSSKLRAQVIENRDEDRLSLIPFVKADGQIFMIGVCLHAPLGKDGQSLERTVVVEERSDVAVIYAFTKSGYLNAEAFQKLFKAFVTLWRNVEGNGPCLLICDNLASHRRLDIAEYVVQHDMEVLYLPPNTSHFLQPLDNLVFAAFKNALSRRYHSEITRLQILQKSDNLLLHKLVLDVFMEAVTTTVVRISFKETGIYPFRKEYVLERTHNFLRKVNSDRELTGDPLEQRIKQLSSKYIEVLLASTINTDRQQQVTLRAPRDKLLTASEIVAESERQSSEKVEAEAEKKRKRQEVEDEKQQQKVDRQLASQLKKRATYEKMLDQARQQTRCSGCRRNVQNNWSGCDCETKWYCQACAAPGKALDLHSAKCDWKTFANLQN